MRKIAGTTLRVTVTGFDKALRKSTVRLLLPAKTKASKTDSLELAYEEKTGTYVASGIPPGKYVLQAEADKYEA
jgi:hypothetical protein